MTDDCTAQLALVRRQLEAAQRISTALFSTTDVDALQRLALQTAMEVVDADAGSLMVYDPLTNSLVFRHTAGPVADTLLGTRIDLSLGEGIAVSVFKTGEARVTEDADAESDHIGAIDARTGYHTRSLMTVPLRSQDTAPLGVFQLVNKRTGPFDAADVATLDVMGSMVVLAMQNARLAQESRIAAVARSVGEISHDIGNMLTQVLPYVQTLESFIADVRADVPGALDALEQFYKEVLEHVSDGVSQVQTRTREIARAIKGEVSPVEFENGHPFRAAMRVISSLAGYAAIRDVAVLLEGDEDLTATYDRSRIYNALYNLVTNSLAETPPGGKVVIAVAPDSNPSFYTLTVRDTGAGMPKEVRERLFTDAARSTKPGGTGLGTRIVRRIVEQHGGTVSVVSAPGEGTAITLCLPYHPAISAAV